MDQLPISLVSNDLKYTLSSLKIKTMEKARQYIVDSKDRQKVQKVQKYLNKYDELKNQINKKINIADIQGQDLQVTQDLNSAQRNQTNLFDASLRSNSMIQICGGKGVGKTALLLYFCQKFSQNSQKKLYFINCSSGITQKRWQRLSKNCPNLEYRDSYILDHVLSVCKTAQEDFQTGFIALDSVTNLLMEEEKTLIFLIKLFKIFSNLINRGVKIAFTNYIQQWFEYKQDDFCTNHYSYYSSVTSQFIKYKYFLKKWPKSQRTNFTMIRGGNLNGEFQIGKNGIDFLKIV